MLVFDELKKNDPTLRLVALALAVGLGILFVGLWWVQVVSSREYQSHLETQAYRTVRLPAVRGKILDREGRVLAENTPRYNLSLFLDDLRVPFYNDYTNLIGWAKKIQQEKIAATEKNLGRKLTKTELKEFRLTAAQRESLRQAARANVAGARAVSLSRVIGEPVPLDTKDLQKHYARSLALPYLLLRDLSPEQVARFQENYTNGLGADLELESVRSYPNGNMAAHLLGSVLRDDDSKDGDKANFSYYLPDYKGVVGIEAGFDGELRGKAGEESVLVNSLGYRQSGNIENAPEPGRNVVLTLDLDLQQVAEKAIVAHQGATARAAAVVMDVRNGDVLALVSSPAISPVYSENSKEYLNDEKLRPAINRATYEIFLPGSIFKVVVGLAALEAGLNPDKQYVVEPNPEDRDHGLYNVRGVKKKDTAPPGLYNFKRAIERSSNSYFIQVGLLVGIDRVIALAQKFHFGQRMQLPTRQDAKGELPTLDRVHHSWREGDSANIFIGQGEVAVTPLQVAAAYSAIANGGTVFWPRLVMRTESQDITTGSAVKDFPEANVRDRLGVSLRSLRVLHAAMVGETEDAEGTGKAACVPGLRICGKTGTAQRMDERGRLTGWNYWFASFAPYESPRYAVVVMVQSEAGGSGGAVCAPIAHDIYEEILRKETAPKENPLAQK